MNKARTLTMFAPYLLVSVIHLIALVSGADAIGDFTKPVLMVLLFVAFLFCLPRARGEVARLGSLGILLSWLGDVALASPDDLGFILGLGFFLLAHLAYVTLFFRRLRMWRPRALALVYAVWLAAFVVLLAPHLGSLLIPVIAYGVVLGSMGALALHCNRWIAVGGALFVVSDSLLGLAKFLPGFALWQSDFLIMLSYLLAQGLIAFGVLRWAWSARSTLSVITVETPTAAAH
ncbi:lysoplasmalogenase [Parafrigoribacterium soli]|uniref:lysoplasmalogenase n=1 Tax=Parafrigoribacterium soli TaxID=3144663 RepID=UPI0032EB650F